MNLEALLDSIKSYNPSADLEIIRKAYDFAVRLHDGQRRASGEPFVIHPFEVATILSYLQMDTTTIAAGLLHDTIEDTVASFEEIEKLFGKEIALLVDGVTKLTAISTSKEQSSKGGAPPVMKSKAESQAENLRKIFLAMAKDIRVILIKLADRLHNLRTLSSLSPEKRKYIAKETLEIFAPITSRLGMWRIKWELEDLAFSHLEPEKYKELVVKVSKKRAEREKMIQEAIAVIERKLEEHGINAHLEGRPKHLYSIYQKLSKRGKDFSEIYDLFAVRILVNTVEECYTVLGTVHSLWIPMKDRIKDYIAVPKSNSYRSLHTTVYGPGDEPLEIQIRTWEMHRIDEYGLAAHWAYKEDKNAKLAKEIYPWIRRIVDWQLDSKDAREYIENLKLDLLESEVFVFTPRGDVIDLPAGSTPIDFAYRIHTEVGHRCVGAKVNAKIVPLDYNLQNADIVEVITSKHATPSLDWLKICRSTHAKNKIRQWFKKERREDNILRGKEILEKELKRHRIEHVLSKDDILLKVTQKLNFVEIDDLFASLGYGESTLPQILTKIRDEMPREVEEVLVPKRPISKKERQSQGIKVKGIDNVLIRFSKCCSPVPGDDIMGYITLGKGISIHRRNCPNMPALSLQTERVVEVAWDYGQKNLKYPVDMEIEAWDRMGLLADIMNIVNEIRVPATSCNAKVRKSKAIVHLCMELADKSQLDEVIKKLSRIKDVIAVGRATSQGDYL
jgi:GTP diphosphokinase / guanosine-3',5'-bis(diphosphate) 3'-diphosphatase